MNKQLTGAQIAEALLTRKDGATMREIIKATGGPQYNKLKQLESRGFTVEKVKEGDETRYRARAPADATFEATVTSKGQVTIPKQVREHLGLRTSQKLRFKLEPGRRATMVPDTLSVQRLFGILGKPPRSATLEEMDEAIRQGAVQRYLRAVGKRR
jgi:antitoxin PrlF